MGKRQELLQAAIARCQELAKENPTGELVFDDELDGILQELIDTKADENAANGVSQHLVGYMGITVPGEPEIHAPYIPVDLRDINWDDYSAPTLVSDSLPEVHPFEETYINWDNAMIPTTPLELVKLQSKGRGLRDDKPQIQFDMTKTRLEDE